MHTYMHLFAQKSEMNSLKHTSEKAGQLGGIRFRFRTHADDYGYVT